MVEESSQGPRRTDSPPPLPAPASGELGLELWDVRPGGSFPTFLQRLRCDDGHDVEPSFLTTSRCAVRWHSGYLALRTRHQYLVPELVRYPKGIPTSRPVSQPLATVCVFCLCVSPMGTSRNSHTVSVLSCLLWLLSLGVMCSRFVHVVTGVRTAPLFKAE